MKIRVLHIIHSLAIGGMECMLVKMLNRMDTGRFAPVIVTFMPGGDLHESVDTSRVEVIQHLKKGVGNDWRLPFRLARILRCVKPPTPHPPYATNNSGYVYLVVFLVLSRVRCESKLARRRASPRASLHRVCPNHECVRYAVSRNARSEQA